MKLESFSSYNIGMVSKLSSWVHILTVTYMVKLKTSKLFHLVFFPSVSFSTFIWKSSLWSRSPSFCSKHGFQHRAVLRFWSKHFSANFKKIHQHNVKRLKNIQNAVPISIKFLIISHKEKTSNVVIFHTRILEINNQSKKKKYTWSLFVNQAKVFYNAIWKKH